MKSDSSLFIAALPDASMVYVKKAHAFLDRFGIDLFGDLSRLEGLSESDSDEVVTWMLDLSCQAQNVSNISIGRYCIQNSPRDWVTSRIARLSDNILTDEDDWEWRRLMEVSSTIDFGFATLIAQRAMSSPNPEIQEAGREFTERKS